MSAQELTAGVLFVTHHRQEAVDLADDVALLLDGPLDARAGAAEPSTSRPR